VKAKNERFKQKGIMCEVVSENDFKWSQNLGNGNTKTLKSCIYVIQKGSRMNSGEYLVPGCGNNGCLNPAHYGKRGVTWESPTPAPAPTPSFDPNATLRSALRPSSLVLQSRRKDPPKPDCFSSLKCPICKCDFHQDGLRFRLCEHPETCGPWEKVCGVCKGKEQEEE